MSNDLNSFLVSCVRTGSIGSTGGGAICADKEFIDRVGKPKIAELLKQHVPVPLYEEDKSFYTDWGDVREFSMKDKGIGECAGEVVTPTDFGLKNADREFFDAQVMVDEGRFQEGGESP